MAVLMRRLITDAQAKLRRMVEEHSANLAARIDTDYPNSIPAPIPDPACFADDIQISNSTHLGQVPDVPSFIPKPLLNAEEPASIALALADADSASDSKRSTFISSRPSSIESRRSKSLCNTSSLDSSEDARGKKDVKKTKSNPVKCESLNITIDSPHDDAKDDAFEDNAAASARDSRSSPDTQSSEKQDSPKAGCSTQRENDSSSPRSPKNLEPGQAGATTLAPSPSGCVRANSGSAIRRLRLENERLHAEITRLRRLVVAGASSILSEKASTENPDEPSDRASAIEIELQMAKEALITLKSDKRRLKAEKFDLLNQMKQLYATLEDKEKELRDFIRNYEQRVRDNETSLQQLSTEREERERERWSLLRHARDEAERSLSLAAQLNAKELQLQQAQEQLQDARRQLASSGCLSDQESLASLPRHSINGGALTPGSGGLLSGHHGIGFLPGDRGSCSADSGVRVTSDRESGANSVAGNLSDSTIDGTPAINIEGSNGDGDSTSIVSSIAPSHIYQLSTKDCSPTLSPLNANSFSRSVNAGVLSRSVEQLSSPLDPEPISVGRRLKHSSHSRLGGGRGGTWGSISRVFARSRHRNKTNSLQENSEYTFESHRSWSPLSEEGYAEKLRLLREASSIPMEKWRAPTVLAWLEVALGMPQYGSRCAENIKSGKVLLELSDLELECGLGITHPMHRKKVRLAIEEHRQPSLVRYPCIAQLGHTWVASEWLSDLGLSQYAENFAGNLVDARMLEHLSKKELEKYLGITRKFHQASIVHGIHLLRIMKYDRQALAVRRHQCENVDADPLVWTNQRFIRWTRSIDLSEYADNLKESGVHGGLVVLEPSFNGDTMATALGIPASKNIIRRHLNAELEALVLPARSTLEHYVRVKTCVLGGGSLGRSFSRSCAGLVGPPPGTPGSRDQSYLTPGSRRTSLKGSISRAFGSITKSSSRTERSEPEKQSPTSSECSSVISRTSFSLHQFRSSRSGGESPIYSTPFAHQNHIYNRRSEEYDSYAHSRALQEEYEMNHHSSHNVNISPNEKNKSFGNTNSIHRSHKKRQHRRVKSIGDIDVIHIEPV